MGGICVLLLLRVKFLVISGVLGRLFVDLDGVDLDLDFAQGSVEGLHIPVLGWPRVSISLIVQPHDDKVGQLLQGVVRPMHLVFQHGKCLCVVCTEVTYPVYLKNGLV